MLRLFLCIGKARTVLDQVFHPFSFQVGQHIDINGAFVLEIDQCVQRDGCRRVRSGNLVEIVAIGFYLYIAGGEVNVVKFEGAEVVKNLGVKGLAGLGEVIVEFVNGDGSPA